ncbi:MAG TPA: glycosyltransferase [Microbacterium sp.]|uniref:glycosyltransferase family 2 protein n=1 Tax=Microbacterium sp. TaxID=51671 RepID=UPI002B4A1F57|nr:glycosyltransferase [Microbacterium sp.]HKT55934.1 glycosyltransferase [Microbacterium sp.]
MTDDLKVSVVIATYRPGKGLDRVIRSLDRQSLPQDQWEAIFVDDGSPDDTLDRLHALAETRPYMRVVQIENSGWPCRPRNVGTDLATGEYVAYMDHDDELYPDALRDGYAFAHASGADVLNGKEARTNDPGWGVDSFRADAAQVKDTPTVHHPLIPANPHKLYRRAFLNEHGIRFREGGRVVWEDIFFNLLVAKHASVISTMSSTPYYHWYETSGSGSTTFQRTRSDWWDWLEKVIVAIDTDLAGDALATQRAMLRRHQYRGRLMGTFNNAFARRPPAERAELFAHAKRLQDAYFTAADDAGLDRSFAMRAQLLRSGRRALLEALVAEDPTIPGAPRVTGARWAEGVLEVDVEATWIDGTGRRPKTAIVDGRIVKSLSRRFDGVFAPELLDMTDDIAGATLELGVRSQSTRINWMVPTQSHVHRVGEHSPDFSVRATSRIDPRIAAMGKPLSRGIWQLTGRCTLGAMIQHRLVPGDIAPAIELDDRGSAAVYARPDGNVMLDYDQTGQPLSALVRPLGTVRREGGRTIIPIAGLPVVEEWSGATKLIVDEDDRRTRITRSLRRLPRAALRRSKTGDGWHPVRAGITVRGERQELVLETETDAPLRLRLGALLGEATSTFALTQGHTALRPVIDRSAPLRRAVGGLWNLVERRMQPAIDRAKRRARRVRAQLRARRGGR